MVSEQCALSERRMLPQVKQRLSNRALSFHAPYIQYLLSICIWQTLLPIPGVDTSSGRQQRLEPVCLLTWEGSSSLSSCGELLIE